MNFTYRILVVLSMIVFLQFLPHLLLKQYPKYLKMNEYRECKNGNNMCTDESRSPWPPTDPHSIRSPESGLYDLTLRPMVRSNSELLSQQYYDILKSLYTGKIIRGSRLKELVQMDQAIRLGGSTPDYQLYPQHIDMREAVRAVREGMPVRERPINDPELLVIQSPKWTCNQSGGLANGTNEDYPSDLVVFVKSCTNCFENRAHARSTYMQPQLWNEFRVQFAFVLGLPSIRSSERLIFEGVEVPNIGKRIANETELNYVTHRINVESATKHDLLIGNFHDTYYNLTLKRIFPFRWASIFCRNQSPLFLFIDDDVSIFPANLVGFVERIPKRARKFFNGGYSGSDLVVPRPTHGSHQWDVSEDEFPWNQYPPYSYGAGNLVGAEMVCDASIAMAFTRFYRMEDVFSGIVWKKLNYPLLGIPGFRLQVPSVKEMNDTIIAFTSSIDQYMDWKTGQPVEKKKRGQGS